MFTTFYRLSLKLAPNLFSWFCAPQEASLILEQPSGFTKRSIMSFGGDRKPNDLSTLYERVDPEIAQLAIAPLSLLSLRFER
jgi:hypothetical protein